MHELVELRLEEAKRTAPAILRRVERKIGVLQDFIGIRTVVRRDRNTDAGSGRHLMIAEIERLAKRFSDSLGQSSGLRNRICHVLDNRELIAAEPGDQGGFSHASTQARRDGLQQDVSCRMSERVVDLLETVEIEHQNRQLGSPSARDCKGVFQPLLEQHAIWQVGERVVQGHIGNLGFRPPLLGDVEVCCHPPAAGHGLSSDTDKSAVGQFIDPARSRVRGQRGQRGNQLVRSAIAPLTLEDAAGNAMFDDFTMGGPHLQQLRRQPIHLRITIVAYDEPLLGIEHA